MDLNWQTISLKTEKAFVKLAAIVLAAAFLLSGVTPSFAEKISPSAEINWDDAPVIEGTSVIMMDAGSGAVLYEKNSEERRDPASVTKIMTCLVVLETMDLDQTLTVNYDVPNEGTNMELKQGESFTVEQLLYALMLWSANDAAEFLAVSTGGSIENFCDMMNERAARCGAVNTTFTNPNGLNNPGHENHRTTASDIALITIEAMKNPEFRTLVSTPSYTIPATELSEARVMENTNLCLYELDNTVEIDGTARPYKYEGNIGVKTGYTNTAGNCFCGWTARGDTELLTVVLNSSSRETAFADSIKLWDYGFAKYETYTVAKSTEPVDEIRVRRGQEGEVAATVAKDLDITLNAGDDVKSITTEVDTGQEKLMAPVRKGDKVASLLVYKDGKLVAEEPLIAMENVEEGGIMSYIGVPDEDTMLFIGGIAGALILLMLIRMVVVSTRRRRRLRRRARRGRSARRKERERQREKNPFATSDNFKDFR